MTPREDAGLTLAILSGLAFAIAAVIVAVARGVEKIRDAGKHSAFCPCGGMYGEHR